MKGPWALMSHCSKYIAYKILKWDIGYLLLLYREREVLYFHHRHLVRMFVIKQPLHEWVTVISAEEHTWWGWSVVLAFVTWCVFASEAECSKSSCAPPTHTPHPTMGAAKWKIFGLWRAQQGHMHTQTHRCSFTCSCPCILHHLCKNIRVLVWVLQCCYYRTPLLPLSSAPSALISFSHISLQ